MSEFQVRPDWMAFCLPDISEAEVQADADVIRSGWWAKGPRTMEFQKKFAEYVGAKHCIAVNSCTAALHLCVRAAGERLYGRPAIGHGAVEGRRGFCTDMTFAATLNPVVYEGGIPVFIDTERDTWNMNPRALERAFEIYPEVQLVVAAHLYGFPGKADEIRAVCDAHGALLIEDAAESMGATYRGRQTGSFGDYAAISYNGNKIITTSGGGMLLSDDEAGISKARFWATQAREPYPWYEHKEIGYNYRMSNIVAGIGRGQLIHLLEHRTKKEAIYRTYEKAFQGLPVRMNPHLPYSQPNFWLSCMTIDPGCTVTPEQIRLALEEENIESRPIWKPMHLQPVFAAHDFVTAGDNVGEDIFARGLCLPSDIKMADSDQERVISVIRGLF